MEQIDSFVTPEGDTVLTMVSDNNFSLIPRTLLLQFTLLGLTRQLVIAAQPT